MREKIKTTILPFVVVLLLGGCSSRNPVQLPGKVGSEIIPDGLYGWSEYSVAYEGDGLYYARYLPNDEIRKNGFVLVKRNNPAHEISFGPEMSSVTVKLGEKICELPINKLRVGKVCDDGVSSITIVDLDLVPKPIRKPGIVPAFRVEKIVFAYDKGK